MSLIRISINKLRLFGFHGLHIEERTAGAEYEIGMEIYFAADRKITRLDETVDYVNVHEIIRKEMENPRPLLETVGMEIANRVKEVYPYIVEINITISKINPPLVNFRGELGVSVINRYQL
jgi:7,8-dihydroneopterin aldolase/epimerase/oxygenase